MLLTKFNESNLKYDLSDNIGLRSFVNLTPGVLNAYLNTLSYHVELVTYRTDKLKLNQKALLITQSNY